MIPIENCAACVEWRFMWNFESTDEWSERRKKTHTHNVASRHLELINSTEPKSTQIERNEMGKKQNKTKSNSLKEKCKTQRSFVYSINENKITLWNIALRMRCWLRAERWPDAWTHTHKHACGQSDSIWDWLFNEHQQLNSQWRFIVLIFNLARSGHRSYHRSNHRCCHYPQSRHSSEINCLTSSLHNCYFSD